MQLFWLHCLACNVCDLRKQTSVAESPARTTQHAQLRFAKLKTQSLARKVQHAKFSMQSSARKAQHAKLGTQISTGKAQHAKSCMQSSARKTQHAKLSTQSLIHKPQHAKPSTQSSITRNASNGGTGRAGELFQRWIWQTYKFVTKPREHTCWGNRAGGTQTAILRIVRTPKAEALLGNKIQ